MRNKNILCMGHRGAMGHAPENTLLSIQTALNLGTKWIEIDIYKVESELVVIHDNRLDRTTNGTGYVEDQTLDYIKSLFAGKGESIPFLREVLNLINGRAGINIELKGLHTAEPVVKLIHQYIESNAWNIDKFLVSSFNHHELLRVKQLFPELRIAALLCGLPIDYAKFGERLSAYSINVSLEFVNKAFVDDAHKRKLKVFVYTVNHPEDMLKIYNIGVDGIITNFPDRFFKLKL